jgi:hypothetical protein
MAGVKNPAISFLYALPIVLSAPKVYNTFIAGKKTHP